VRCLIESLSSAGGKNPVAVRMLDIDSRLPSHSEAGANWNHNLAAAFDLYTRVQNKKPDKLARVLSSFNADDWLKGKKATDSLAMVKKIDAKLARDIVAEVMFWKAVKDSAP